ncbi:hypothetical protein Tco_1100951, partial [Tanacetum coccineum]
DSEETDEDELKGIETLSSSAQYLVDMKTATKASKDDFILQQRSKGLCEGSGVILEVPDGLSDRSDSSSSKSEDEEGFLSTDDEASQEKSEDERTKVDDDVILKRVTRLEKKVEAMSKQYSFFNAFIGTADVPEISMRQFWYTVTYNLEAKTYFFTLDDKSFKVNADLLRDALHITSKDSDHPFVTPPPHDEIVLFIKNLDTLDLLIKYQRCLWELNQKKNPTGQVKGMLTRKVFRSCGEDKNSMVQRRSVHDSYRRTGKDRRAEDVKDATEQPGEEQAMDEQARIDQPGKVQVEVSVPDPQLKLRFYRWWMFYLSSVPAVQRPRLVDTTYKITTPTHKKLCDALIESLLVDENDMDNQFDDPPNQKKRRHNDEDPFTDANKEAKKRRRMDTRESSKKNNDQAEDLQYQDAALVVEESIRDDVVDVEGPTQEDTYANLDKSKWFKQDVIVRPETLDPDWFNEPNANDAPEQSWFNELVNAEKDPMQFDDLMVGLSDPEETRYPYDFTKPLPLKAPPGCTTIHVDFFFNKYLEYLKTVNKEKTYASSQTKPKAARYELEGLKEMNPKLWSSSKVQYEKDDTLRIHHCGSKRQLFYKARHG